MSKFGKTQKEMIWVMTSACVILMSHEWKLGFPLAKRKTRSKIISGNKKPEIIPTATLSYFSENFIF
jgi:hypothetical protein